MLSTPVSTRLGKPSTILTCSCRCTSEMMRKKQQVMHYCTKHRIWRIKLYTFSSTIHISFCSCNRSGKACIMVRLVSLDNLVEKNISRLYPIQTISLILSTKCVHSHGIHCFVRPWHLNNAVPWHFGSVFITVTRTAEFKLILHLQRMNDTAFI